MTDSQQFNESRFRAHRESTISKSLIFREIGSTAILEAAGRGRSACCPPGAFGSRKGRGPTKWGGAPGGQQALQPWAEGDHNWGDLQPNGLSPLKKAQKWGDLLFFSRSPQWYSLAVHRHNPPMLQVRPQIRLISSSDSPETQAIGLRGYTNFWQYFEIIARIITFAPCKRTRLFLLRCYKSTKL